MIILVHSLHFLWITSLGAIYSQCLASGCLLLASLHFWLRKCLIPVWTERNPAHWYPRCPLCPYREASWDLRLVLQKRSLAGLVFPQNAILWALGTPHLNSSSYLKSHVTPFRKASLTILSYRSCWVEYWDGDLPFPSPASPSPLVSLGHGLWLLSLPWVWQGEEGKVRGCWCCPGSLNPA